MILPRSSNPDRIRDNLHGFVVDVEALFSSSKSHGGGDGDSDGHRLVDEKGASGEDNGGGGEGKPGQECRAAVASGSGGLVVKVFLTEEDMVAIDHLDGSLGN